MLEHHEVERFDHSFIDACVRVLGDLKDVRHRVAIARERQLRFCRRVERRFAFDGGGHVVEARVVALDAVRALDGHHSHAGARLRRGGPPASAGHALQRRQRHRRTERLGHRGAGRRHRRRVHRAHRGCPSDHCAARRCSSPGSRPNSCLTARPPSLNPREVLGVEVVERPVRRSAPLPHVGVERRTLGPWTPRPR